MAPDVHPGGPVIDQIDSSTAQPAHRYNYWLGGKDNFAVDRRAEGEPEPRPDPAHIAMYAGVGRKP
jgi:hypothetical protein